MYRKVSTSAFTIWIVASETSAILAGLYGNKIASMRLSPDASMPPDAVKRIKFCGSPEHFVVMPNDLMLILWSRCS